MSNINPRAYHRTMLTLAAATCVVREPVGEVMQRIHSADSDWFAVTADPEGEAVWINARQILCGGRERSPIEAMEAAR